MSDRPTYRHDCVACTFLGCFRGHDLYYCEQHGLPTVIARYGDEGSAYTSGMALADVDPILAEAKARSAQHKGVE